MPPILLLFRPFCANVTIIRSVILLQELSLYPSIMLLLVLLLLLLLLLMLMLYIICCIYRFGISCYCIFNNDTNSLCSHIYICGWCIKYVLICLLSLSVPPLSSFEVSRCSYSLTASFLTLLMMTTRYILFIVCVAAALLYHLLLHCKYFPPMNRLLFL